MKIAALVSSAGLIASAAQAADGNAVNGEQLYADFACYACHGHNATGRVPLSQETSGVLSRADVFLRYMRLRADQNPVNPKNSMPNYSAETLSDAQALDIYAYLVSLEHETPDVDDIPLMQDLIDDAERRATVENND